MHFLQVTRTVAEVGMFVCLAWGGWLLAPDGLGRPALALLLPALAAVVWSLWVAPRAPRRLADPTRLRVELALLTGALLLVSLSQVRPAVLIGVLAWAAFMLSLRARGSEPAPPSP